MAKGCPECAGMQKKMDAMQSKMDEYAMDEEEEDEPANSGENENTEKVSGINDFAQSAKDARQEEKSSIYLAKKIPMKDRVSESLKKLSKK